MRLLALAVLLGLLAPGASADALGEGDRLWSERAVGEREGRPQPEPILAAVAAYQRALEEAPERLEARWKLLRALHFAAEFVARDDAERLRYFERACAASEDGLARMARAAGGVRLEELSGAALVQRLAASGLSRSDVARLYFWSAINWGGWSRAVGLLGAVRQGVANRLHGYTQVTLALEADYEEGGALRLLGSLHAELPRVPFVSSWVDRERALPLLERAYGMAPANPGNQLLLAQLLIDRVPARREEALELLGRVERLTPRPTMRVEDLAMRKRARERTAEVRGG